MRSPDLSLYSDLRVKYPAAAYLRVDGLVPNAAYELLSDAYPFDTFGAVRTISGASGEWIGKVEYDRNTRYKVVGQGVASNTKTLLADLSKSMVVHRSNGDPRRLSLRVHGPPTGLKRIKRVRVTVYDRVSDKRRWRRTFTFKRRPTRLEAVVRLPLVKDNSPGQSTWVMVCIDRPFADGSGPPRKSRRDCGWGS